MKRVTRQLQALGRGYFWVAVDQSAFSGFQVLIHLLCIHVLSQGDYGVFALTGATTLVLLRVHHALLMEPALVFYPTLPRDERERYLDVVAGFQGVFERGIVAVGALLALVVAPFSTQRALLVVGMASFILGAHTIYYHRKLAYLTQTARWIAVKTSLRGVLAVAGIASCSYLTDISVWMVLLVVGAAFHLPGNLLVSSKLRDEAWLSRHWAHGRLAVAIFIVWTGVDVAPHYVLATIAGVDSVAVYQTAAMCFSPLGQLGGTILIAAIPRFVAARTGGSSLLRAAIPSLSLAALVSMAIALVGLPLVPLVFGVRYEAAAQLLFPLCAYPVFLMTTQLVGNWLKAQQVQTPLLIAGLVGLPAMSASVLLGYHWGELRGASWGVSAGYLGFALSVVLLARRASLRRSQRTDAA